MHRDFSCFIGNLGAKSSPLINKISAQPILKALYPNTVDIPSCRAAQIPDSLLSRSGDQLRGTVVHVTCLAGFSRLGPGSVTCLDTGQWSDSPECKRLGESQ